LWPEIVKGEAVLIEESTTKQHRYYVLTVLRGGYTTEIRRNDLVLTVQNLNVARMQNYGPKAPCSPTFATGIGSRLATLRQRRLPRFPRQLRIDRPHDDYRIRICKSPSLY